MRAQQILEESAQHWPDKAAIIENGIPISYRELYDECHKLAEQLRQAGLSPGQGLAVIGKNSAAFIAAMFAGMVSGATVLPLSHQLKPAEIDAAIRDSGIHAVIDDGSALIPSHMKSTTLPFMQRSLGFFRTPTPTNQIIAEGVDAAFIRYTSGTTGRSKGVVLSHDRVLERLNAAQTALKLSADDTILWVLPMAYHFLVTIMLYIRCGTTLVICKDLLAQTLLSDAEKYRPTFLYASPMHFRLLAADRSGKRLDSLRQVISTSSSIPPSIAASFTERFGLPVAQAYGIIEVGLPLLDNGTDGHAAETVGHPMPGFDIKLLSPDDAPVATGQTGQLAIRGPGMFNAYLSPWQLSQNVMRDGWFMTGDLARVTIDGKIMICGREKSMINVSGNKAFPEEIEEVLNAFPGVTGSRAFGNSHPLMGEIVCAEIVLDAGASCDNEAIMRYCRERLCVYKIPQRFYRVDTIKRTSSGKIDRNGGWPNTRRVS